MKKLKIEKYSLAKANKIIDDHFKLVGPIIEATGSTVFLNAVKTLQKFANNKKK